MSQTQKITLTAGFTNPVAVRHYPTWIPIYEKGVFKRQVSGTRIEVYMAINSWNNGSTVVWSSNIPDEETIPDYLRKGAQGTASGRLNWRNQYQVDTILIEGHRVKY